MEVVNTDKPKDLVKVTSAMNEENCLCSTSARVNGQLVTVHFDPGATKSIMSTRIWTHLKLNVNPSETQIKFGNNAVEKVFGITDDIQIDIQGVIATMNFLIYDHEDHDFLIGLDWFKQTNAALIPGDNIINFQV